MERNKNKEEPSKFHYDIIRRIHKINRLTPRTGKRSFLVIHFSENCLDFRIRKMRTFYVLDGCTIEKVGESEKSEKLMKKWRKSRNFSRKRKSVVELTENVS